jgi:DNA-binding XRE family transcriptional regulator
MLEENRFENVLASFQARKGWTQEDAAAHIGVSRSTYSGWITGKNIPASKQLIKIASGLNLNHADNETLNRAAAHTPPRIHNLPFPRNPLFTGRATYLEQLDTHFKTGDSVALTQPISISGLGGIGKTQLALEYAHQSYRTNVYQAVFWVNAADERALQDSYVKLAHRLELPERDEQERALIVQAVKDWLERHTN